METGSFQRRALPAAIISLLVCGSAAAEEPIINDAHSTLDRIVLGPDLLNGVEEPLYQFYVADHETYDSNIFRLPSGSDVHATVAPDASRSDLITTPAAGFGAQWLLGRQVVNVQGSVNYSDFKDNSGLSNVGSDDKVVWDWALSSLLSGQIGATYTRQLLSFVNSTIFTKDELERTEYYASGRYQIGPHWDVYSAISEAKITLSNPELVSNGNTQKSVIVGGDLITSPLNSVGVDYRYVDTRYLYAQTIDTVVGSDTFRPGYREDRVRVTLKRSLSDKTLLDGNVGYMHRDYGTDVIGAFSGPVWRVSVGWAPSDKTQLVGAVYRDLQAYFTDDTNYYRATGVSLAPNWNPTDKLSLKFLVSRESQSYIGSSSVITTTPARHDNVTAEQLQMTYIPVRALALDASIRHETRSSNDPFFPYVDTLAVVGARFTF